MNDLYPQKKNLKDRIPSFVWVLIMVGGIILLIGSIIGLFFLLANVEGVASVIFLVLGILGAGFFSKSPPVKNSFGIAIFVGFFALMGASVDQPGNYLYNKPLEIFFCPEGTSLNRSVDVLHPVPGRTDIIQDFTCYNKSNEPVKRIDMFAIIGVRFFEYVLIAYLLIFLRNLIWRFRSRKDTGITPR